jgi:hypothetical protein
MNALLLNEDANAQGPTDENDFVRIGDSSITDYDCFIVSIKDRGFIRAPPRLCMWTPTKSSARRSSTPIETARLLSPKQWSRSRSNNKRGSRN